MHEANDIIHVFFENRQQGVRALAYYFQYLFNVIFHINADNFITRHHNVFNSGLFQVQDIHQHPVMFDWNQCAAFVQYSTQFIFGKVVRHIFFYFKTAQLYQPIGHCVNHPHQWVADFQQQQ